MSLPYRDKKLLTSPLLPLLTLLCVLTCALTTPQAASRNERLIIKEAGISIPKPAPAWKESSPDSKGIVFRIIRPMPVSGAPRIDIIVEPINQGESHTTFVSRSLTALYNLVKDKKIRITYEDKRTLRQHKLVITRLRHDWVLKQVGAKAPSISQVSYLFLHEGNAVTVTAVGRTEFYQPFSDDIEEMLQGIRPLTVEEKGGIKAITVSAKRFFSVQQKATPDIITAASLAGGTGAAPKKVQRHGRRK